MGVKNTGENAPTIDLVRNSSTFGADTSYDWRIKNGSGKFKIQTSGTNVFNPGLTGLRTMMEIDWDGTGTTFSENVSVSGDITNTGNIISATAPTVNTTF